MQTDQTPPYRPLSVYDQTVEHLRGRRDVATSKPSTLRHYTPVRELQQTWTVQTFRILATEDKPSQDYVSVEVGDLDGLTRLFLPPAVVSCIVRQCGAVGAKVRKAHGKRIAAERAARGELPGFMRKRKAD